MKDWKWLGHKQHFIGADSCHFSLATLLPNGYLVSTIGNYYPDFKQDFKWIYNSIEIGADRLFETMVFKTKNGFKTCGCPIISESQEDYFEGYNTAQDAQEGHIKMCLKIEKLERIEE